MSQILLMFYEKATALVHDETGTTAIEYGLIAMGIALGVMALIFSFGGSLVTLWEHMLALLNTHSGSASS